MSKEVTHNHQISVVIYQNKGMIIALALLVSSCVGVLIFGAGMGSKFLFPSIEQFLVKTLPLGSWSLVGAGSLIIVLSLTVGFVVSLYFKFSKPLIYSFDSLKEQDIKPLPIPFIEFEKELYKFDPDMKDLPLFVFVANEDIEGVKKGDYIAVIVDLKESYLPELVGASTLEELKQKFKEEGYISTHTSGSFCSVTDLAAFKQHQVSKPLYYLLDSLNEEDVKPLSVPIIDLHKNLFQLNDEMDLPFFVFIATEDTEDWKKGDYVALVLVKDDLCCALIEKASSFAKLKKELTLYEKAEEEFTFVTDLSGWKRFQQPVPEYHLEENSIETLAISSESVEQELESLPKGIMNKRVLILKLQYEETSESYFVFYKNDNEYEMEVYNTYDFNYFKFAMEKSLSLLDPLQEFEFITSLAALKKLQ